MTSSQEGLTAKALAREIRDACSGSPKPLKFMEVCGTHTMAIAAAGLKSLLRDKVRLVSGPGCPVCVTEKQFIDEAIALGREHDALPVTFGDLVRVPGSNGSLGSFRSEGGSIHVVYSPMDVIDVALRNSPRPTVFLGVGFETTIPTIAATILQASRQGVENLYVLPAFKTIHPALRILAAKDDLNGFLLPGHVSAIIGSDCYGYLPEEFGKPGVVAGFEPLDILLALRDLVRLASNGTPRIVNDYKRVVRSGGNRAAQDLIYQVFDPADAAWRGLGVIPGSGLQFKDEFRRFDALSNLPVDVPRAEDDPRCQCAAILTGSRTPDKCGLFGKECTPEQPVGPCMVSSEGTCAAYYKYGFI